jgi:hypothetical protein
MGNWKERASGERIRTFAIITTDANELVARHPRPHAGDLTPRDARRLTRAISCGHIPLS